MKNELAGFLAALSHTHSVNDIVKAALKQLEKVFAGDTFLAVSLFEVVSELLLENAVVSLGFLLLSHLHAVLFDLLVSGTVLTGSCASAVNGAFARHTSFAFKEELGAFSAAESANRTSISCHIVITSVND